VIVPAGVAAAGRCNQEENRIECRARRRIRRGATYTLSIDPDMNVDAINATAQGYPTATVRSVKLISLH
jgi:hypothetical protein